MSREGGNFYQSHYWPRNTFDMSQYVNFHFNLFFCLFMRMCNKCVCFSYLAFNNLLHTHETQIIGWYCDFIFILERSADSDNLLLCAQSPCNARKTVCRVVNPQCRSRMVSTSFPHFTLESLQLQFVSSFRYLRHIITNTLSDKYDIQYEIKSMLFRTNILIRKFSHCSFTVKCSLLKSYWLSLYDIDLSRMFTVSYMNKLRSRYNKCIKSYFEYHCTSSMTQALLQTGLLSFDTVLTFT